MLSVLNQIIDLDAELVVEEFRFQGKSSLIVRLVSRAFGADNSILHKIFGQAVEIHWASQYQLSI